jgi:hypothetical protein
LLEPNSGLCVRRRLMRGPARDDIAASGRLSQR